MNVQDLMTRNPACCTPKTSLRDVAKAMVEHDCGCIPVVQSERDKQLVGIVTDRDIACRTVAEGKNPLEMTAGDCMSAPVVSVTQDASLADCCREMEDHLIRRLPVTDEDDSLCGIVAQADVARHAPEHDTAHVVKDVSAPSQAASRI